MRSSLLAVIIALLVALPIPQRSVAAKEWLTVRVKKGDTLSRIARKYGVTVAELRRNNRRVLRKILRPGMRLRVRTKRQKKTTRRRRDKRTGAKGQSKRVATAPSKKKRRDAMQPRSAASKSKRRKRATRTRGQKGPWITYRTKRGDTLTRIAKRFSVKVRDLKRHNRRVKKVRAYRRLKRGMRLRIKKRSKYNLVGGVQLPRKGIGYKRMRPERSWGTPCTIELIQDVYARFTTRNPGSVPGMIADISDKDGGWLPPHKSHQRGVDIDVSYYKRDNTRLRGLEVVTPQTMDVEKTWDLIRLFINTGHVDMIFMDYRLQAVLYRYLKTQGYAAKQMSQWLQYPKSRRERSGLIRHSPGHHHHLHIRFDCINPEAPCRRPRTVLVPETKSRRNQRLRNEHLPTLQARTPHDEKSTVIRPLSMHSTPSPNKNKAKATAETGHNSRRTDATANSQRPPDFNRSHPPKTPAILAVQRPAAPSPVHSPHSFLFGKGMNARRPGEKPARMSRFGATLL